MLGLAAMGWHVRGWRGSGELGRARVAGGGGLACEQSVNDENVSNTAVNYILLPARESTGCSRIARAHAVDFPVCIELILFRTVLILHNLITPTAAILTWGALVEASPPEANFIN